MIGGDDPKVLTEFGATVMSLAFERGINQQVKLAALLRNPDGEPVSPQRLSPWLRGVNTPPNWLPRAIAGALELGEEECIKLALAFSFGADRKLHSVA